MEGKPKRLQELEGRALRLHAATEALAEQVEVARSKVRELTEARLKLAERVTGSGEVGEPSGAGRLPGPVWQAVDRALYRTARSLRDAARAALLDRTSYSVRERSLTLSGREISHSVSELLQALRQG